MIFSMDLVTQLTFEDIRKASPKNIHRNHIVLSGVPMLIDFNSDGLGLALFPDFRNIPFPTPVGIVYRTSDHLLVDSAKRAAWAIVEGSLTVTNEAPTVIANNIRFFDSDGVQL